MKLHPTNAAQAQLYDLVNKTFEQMDANTQLIYKMADTHSSLTKQANFQLSILAQKIYSLPNQDGKKGRIIPFAPNHIASHQKLAK